MRRFIPIGFVALFTLGAVLGRTLPEVLKAASADQTFPYSGGTYDLGRLGDELIAAGITPIVIRGSSTSISIVVADGVTEASVAAVVSAHNPATTKASDLILVRRNATNDGYEIGRIGGTWSPFDPDMVRTTRKAADQSVTSNSVLADCTGLSFSVAANKVYHFDFTIYFTAAANTTGLVLSVNGPTNPVAVRFAAQIGESATAWRTGVQTTYDSVIVGTASTSGTALVAHVKGTIQTGSSGGTLVVRFRSEINNSQVTILRGSSGEIKS